MVSRAFRSAGQGGGIQRLSDVVQASLGSTLARTDFQIPAEKTPGESAFAYYQKNSEALQRDKRYFQTWFVALNTARALNDHQLNNWESTADLTWIPASQKADAWGHFFCVQSSSKSNAVISPGPNALANIDCKSLTVRETNLLKLQYGRLNPDASGALILILKRSPV
jgi:hypothetical protein